MFKIVFTESKLCLVTYTSCVDEHRGNLTSKERAPACILAFCLHSLNDFVLDNTSAQVLGYTALCHVRRVSPKAIHAKFRDVDVTL